MTSPSLSSDVRSNSEILLNFPVFVSQKTGARQITLFHTCIIPVNLCRWCGNWERDDANKLVKNQEVWDKFMARDILRRIPANSELLRNMLAIYIDCGTSDQFGLLTEAQRVHEELQRLDITHEYREFDGNHTCCVMNSTGDALEVFSNTMAFEMIIPKDPVTPAQHKADLKTR
ncbi:hypothetical protein H8E77_10090 [bacterium]|nr:hypothetical protein [bacterium]